MDGGSPTQGCGRVSAQALIIATPEDLAGRVDIQPARSTTVISGHSGPATRAEAVTGALPRRGRRAE